MELPNEPNMLLSIINMKLRDQYSSLEHLCDDLDLSYKDTLEQITSLGLRYDETNNQIKIK